MSDNMNLVPSEMKRIEDQRRYDLEQIRAVAEAGISHVLVQNDPQGSFISPDKRYPQRRVLYAGTLDECNKERQILTLANARNQGQTPQGEKHE